jgi:hypothetical protein
LWYDELIRIADYFAGTVAALDIKANVVPSDKFVRLLRGVIADAENVAILRLRIGDDGLQVKGREISLHPIAPTLRIGSAALRVSSARLARLSERLFRVPPGAKKQRIVQAHRALQPLRNLARSGATRLTTRQKDAISTILSEGITLIELSSWMNVCAPGDLGCLKWSVASPPPRDTAVRSPKTDLALGFSNVPALQGRHSVASAPG